MTASLWDQRFAVDGYVFGTEPNAFLKREAIRLPPHGRVLAVADGEGRNGVFLAQRGFDVVATDISSAGLAKANRLAKARGVALTMEQRSEQRRVGKEGVRPCESRGLPDD